MNKIFFSFLLLGSTTFCFAHHEASQFFMNSVTVCPAETNPLTFLKKAGGNAFGEAEFDPESAEAVLVDLINDPHLINPLIMRPTILLGKIRVQRSYPEPGYALTCRIEKIN